MHGKRHGLRLGNICITDHNSRKCNTRTHLRQAIQNERPSTSQANASRSKHRTHSRLFDEIKLLRIHLSCPIHSRARGVENMPKDTRIHCDHLSIKISVSTNLYLSSSRIKNELKAETCISNISRYHACAKPWSAYKSDSRETT